MYKSSYSIDYFRNRFSVDSAVFGTDSLDLLVKTMGAERSVLILLSRAGIITGIFQSNAWV